MIKITLFFLLISCCLNNSNNNLSQQTPNNTCQYYPCIDCTSNGLSCNTCIQQYYLDTATNQCLQCFPPCLSCFSPTQCQICNLEYYVQNGVCTNCPFDPTGCSTQNCCNGCFLNNYYIYQSNLCYSCVTTSVCLSCINPNAYSNCSLCPVGFSLLNQTCINCSLAITNCLTCNLQNLPQVSCSGCLAGFYLDGGNCFMCPYTCSACSNSIICTSCISQYYLNGTNQCSPCITPFCSMCYYSNQIQICQSCIQSYLLNNSQCIQQTCGKFCLTCNLWGCLSCFPGYYPNQNGCSQCQGGCVSCTGYWTGCICPAGLTLINFGCLLCGSNCLDCIQVSTSQSFSQTNCVACFPGYYLDWLSISNYCQPCPTNCLYCMTISDCYICNTSYYLTIYGCLPCSSNCQNCINITSCLICNYQFYLNSTTQLCQSCMVGCINCLNSQTCLLCLPNFGLVDGQCNACPFNISNCNKCSQTFCYSCNPQYYASNGICVSCTNNCYTCVNSSYCTQCQQSWIVTQNNQCVRCGQNCLVCLTIEQCVACISDAYLVVGSKCVIPLNLQWWQITSLVLFFALILFFVGLTFRKQIVSIQIKAIVYNNLIINHINKLFWKELAVSIFILLVMIIQVETQINNIFQLPNKVAITVYNMFAIILIARASVMIHMQNRQKFLYFQKAYGLNSIAYTLTWTLYSLLAGIIHFIIYLVIEYIYLKCNNSHFFHKFNGSISYLDQAIMTYEYFCLLNFLAYISTYSYFLFAAIVINHNQLGLKLLTPILALGIIGIQQQNLIIDVDITTYVFLSPIGWLASICQYQVIPNQFLLKQSLYMPVFFAHFFIPIILAFIVEFIKINQIQIKIILINNYKKLYSKIKLSSKIQLLNQTQLQNTSDLSWLIKIQNLNKNINKKDILKNINLIIRKNQIISLYGKNGSAKSTFFNILTNIDNFSQGSFVFSKSIKIGISLENNFFQDQLTVKENLQFYAKLKGISIDEQTLALQGFGLSDFWDKKYFKISGGNRKKLSIACAFLGQNDIVLLDYPAMGIDYAVKKDIQLIIKQQKQKNKQLTIIITTCNKQIDFIELIDRLWVIQNGEIIVNQQIKDIKLEYQNIIIGNITFEKGFQQQCIKQMQTIKNIKIKRVKQNIQLSFHDQQFSKVIAILKKHQLFDNFQCSTAPLQQKIQWKINKTCQQQNLEQQFELLKTFYAELQPKKNFFNLFLSSIAIRYYQIIPSIFDILYFLLMPLICWGFQLWLLKKGSYFDDKFLGFQFFLTFYPYIVIFMYSHIAVSQVKFQQNGYQNIIFKMGMKKIPYWLASYIINIIIIIIPTIIMLGAAQQNSLFDSAALGITFYSIAFTLLSYFATILFKSNYVCFSFLSIIFAVIVTYLNSIIYYYKQTQNPQMLATVYKIYMILVPSFLFGIYGTYRELYFLCNIFIYSFLYFSIKKLLFIFRNSKKAMGSSQMLKDTYEGAIQQKLKILDITQNQSQNQNMSLVISDVYLKYSKSITGIKGLNLCVEKGNVFALLGMNGSGKSTTIKLITNQSYKTVGNIYFNFQQIKSQTSQIYEKISISPQYNYFIPSMKVHIHLRIFCAIKGIQFSLQTKLINSLLKLFKMENCINLTIQQLSGGDQRKLKFITALLGKPQFLLMDQPLVGVDDQGEEMFGKMLMLLTQQFKSSCVYITHKLSEVEKYSNKLGIMKRGGLVLCELNKKLIQKYSRGVQINLYSNSLKELQKNIKPMLDQKIKVYQILIFEESGFLKILIPFQQFKFDWCISLILGLKQNEDISGFQLKKDGLAEAFDYMVHQTDTELIISPNQ